MAIKEETKESCRSRAVVPCVSKKNPRQHQRAEDVLTHQRLLKLAENPATRHVFEVRGVQVFPTLNEHSADADPSDPAVKEDAQGSYHSSRQGYV
ncbi:unnamed protein product [Thlaspi arvense]|uniref:Uncharacterized protein n=1 Tax=Thlaspi arvense TaxID=13288 RepID=A0AAU9SZD3_THLAR|nr:unnamed protein product [Thlaspi arvense]